MQSLVLGTNIDSLIVQSSLSTHTRNVNISTERLATGFRINKPSDDAAGYVYSEKLDSRIRGIDVAQRNINDGIALLDTADSSLTTVVDNLQRIRELIVEAEGGGQTPAELDAAQIEINELVTEIDDLRQNTEFNGRRLLDPKAWFSTTLQIGPDSNDTYNIDFTNLISIDIERAVDGGAGFPTPDIALTAGTPVAPTHTGFIGSDNDDNPDNFFALNKISLSTTVASQDGNITTGVVGGELDSIDGMIDNVSNMQATVAAKRNRLSSEFNFLTDEKFNLEAAKSNVMDADIALESTKLTVNQVLQQSAVTLLAQANAAPNLALALIP